jgi:uncharacterized protein YqgC (DUF456 family)
MAQGGTLDASWLDLTFRFIVLFGLLVSWILTIVPIFPGPTVMWALVLIYGVVAGFGTLGAILFGIISVLTVTSWLTDNFLSIKGAREGGAEWSSVAIASLAGVISSLFLTPFVGILLTLSTLYLVELSRKSDSEKAWRATTQMLLGWGWATVARMGLGLAVLALWVGWAWL